jgi:putative DNA primase/helicase
MRKLSFCLGSSRQAATWHPSQMTLEELWTRLVTPIRTPETTAQYHKLKKAEKDAIKDKGGFLAGTLKGTRRKKTEVVSRSMITLDCDKLNPSFFDEYEFLNRHLSLVYTTHTHLPESPRARILIPLTRDVTPEEYNAIARYLADETGMEMIDPCSFEINQLMYWPTASSDGEYICRRYEGDWLDPDAYLAEHPNWKDCTALPTAPAEKAAVEKQRKKQEDPLAKEGTVGLFCRAYTVQEAMRTFLPDVYEETDDDSRWRYIPSDSMPGVVIYDDKFAYSHHASDPAFGKLLNAFDLVRTHLFDDEDPKKSFNDMLEFVARDEEVKALALEERRERAGEDFADPTEDGDDWKAKLVRQKKSTQLENSLFNIKLIMQNDPYMKNIVFNQLADGMEIKGEVPWQHPAKFWRDADDAQLICYVDDHYGTFSARNYDIAVTKAVDDRSYHPIKDYFASLPPWDGVPRVDTLLIDYLGAEDNSYIRAVSRKTLCAAYRRVYQPGVKFDYMPVLNGAQGIGKSTFIANLGMEWFSDSLNLSDMNDKTAAEKLQGYWIIEIGELAGMKKADLDKVKAFISRVDDKYRASFGRRVTPHPRQCVFFGTTNSENGYLQDITGNRRFWNVKATGEGKYKPWQMTPETVQQIWAETAVLAKAGEKLYLPPELEAYAQKEQRAAMEQDDREGLVLEYLDMLLPDGWDGMDIYKRRDYINEPDDPTRPTGKHRRTEVSNIEIWCECFGRPKEDMKPTDRYAIAAIMEHLDDWEKSGKHRRLPIYGKQRMYQRK